MPTIDLIIMLLEDGKWHNLSEILEKSQLTDSETRTIIDFLSEYNIVHVAKGPQKIRLTSQTLHFLKRIRETEKSQGLCWMSASESRRGLTV